jgi:hypothetical protein
MYRRKREVGIVSAQYGMEAICGIRFGRDLVLSIVNTSFGICLAPLSGFFRN